MTNKQLRKRWRNLSLQFKTIGDTKPMTDMFLICWGETTIKFEDKDIKVVVFDPGGEQGAAALFCQCDGENNCVAYGIDSTTNTHVKSIIGKFVVNEKNKKK